MGERICILNQGKLIQLGTPLDIYNCLLYTSDAADDSLRVDLGGRRIIKKITAVDVMSASVPGMRDAPQLCFFSSRRRHTR